MGHQHVNDPVGSDRNGMDILISNDGSWGVHRPLGPRPGRLVVENLSWTGAGKDNGASYLVTTRTQKPTTMPAVQGYCVKCKTKRDIKDAKEVEMANGRKAMKGTCPVCGTGMFKILGK